MGVFWNHLVVTEWTVNVSSGFDCGWFVFHNGPSGRNCTRIDSLEGYRPIC
jgi:hypothetical protein